MEPRIIPSEEIAHRTDFALLCNARGIEVGVEVGVDLGVFAVDFLRRWMGRMLLLVDPYLPYPEMNLPREADALTAALALIPFHGRCRFMKVESQVAAKHLPCWEVDNIGFVYIDADHTKEAVATDLRTWMPVLKPDGILAGHDFDDQHPGVKEAVYEYAKEHHLVVRVTQDSLPSWYIYKTEPRVLHRFHFQTGQLPNPYRSEEV